MSIDVERGHITWISQKTQKIKVFERAGSLTDAIKKNKSYYK